MRRGSTSSVSRLPNDVQWIGKADRLKSIMLGDHREGTALAEHCPTGSVSTERPRYPWTPRRRRRRRRCCRCRRVSIQSGWKRYLNMCNE